MGHRRLGLLAAGLAFSASCTSRDSGDGASRPGHQPVDSANSSTASVAWFDGTAPLLLVPAHSNDRALIVTADSLQPDLEEGTLEQMGNLVRLAGQAASVRVTVGSGGEGCVDAALDPAPSTSWGAGFVGRVPNVLQVDSLGSIARQDSAAIAPIVFRLASGVPNTVSRFAGLPFALTDLWRVRMPDGAVVLVATTRRQINQEDSPLEERTLLIAEGDSAGRGYTLVHSSRSTGPEETVEGSDLLAAVTFPGRNDVQFLFGHDFGGQVSYSIVDREAPRQWKLYWASRRFSC